MELKQLVLKFVRAIKQLLITQPSAEDLAKAHAETAAALQELADLKNADAAAAEASKFTPEEQGEVDEALLMVAAAAPPVPANVQVVEAKLETDTGTAPA